MPRQHRRQFLSTTIAIVGMSVLAGCGMLPPVGTSPPRVRRIGYLATNYFGRSEIRGRLYGVTAVGFDTFRVGLRDLGYVEGENVEVALRAADYGNATEIEALAAELVGLQIDVLVASGVTPAGAAARATSVAPVVLIDVGAPVETGLVQSLARPGGNVTGLTSFAPELAAKRLELLKEAAPSISRPAVLWGPTDTLELAATQAAAPRLGLQIRPLEVRTPEQLYPALDTATRQGADAIVVIATDVGYVPIATTALRARIPTVAHSRDFATVTGGLLALGPSYPAMHRRAATYVDKILKGTKPADLPVEQPTTFELVVNLKTAQALGLTIPPSVLIQATEVIQ